MKEIQSTKLFYNKYKYRIKTKGRYDYMCETQLNSADYRAIHIESIEKAHKIRNKVEKYLKDNNVDFRSRTESGMSVFLNDEEVFESLKKIHYDDIREVSVPYRDDLPEVLGDLPNEVEVRKSLYFGQYRYKMIFRPDESYDSVATESIREFLKNADFEYCFDSNIQYSSANPNKAKTKNGYSANLYGWKDYYIMFKDEETVSYAAMMISNIRIKKVKQVVLTTELE